MNVQSANYINPYIHKVNTGFDKTGKRIVTIAELYAESGFSDTLNSKIAEADGKEIQRISFEDLEWYTPEFDESGTDTFLIREQQFDSNVTMNYINKLKKIHSNRCMYGHGQPDFNMALSQILNRFMYR